MKRFSADAVFCAQKLAATLSLAAYCLPPASLVCCSPIFAVRHLLRRSRCAPSRRFAFAAFDMLSCAGWKLTLGSGPGWVGLRSKLLIDVAMKISMSQIL